MSENIFSLSLSVPVSVYGLFDDGCSVLVMILLVFCLVSFIEKPWADLGYPLLALSLLPYQEPATVRAAGQCIWDIVILSLA